MSYEDQILSKLIDSFEKRSLENARVRPVQIDIEKSFPGYRDILSDVQCEIDTAIDHLQSWGFVKCSKNQQGYYTKVILIVAAVSQIYAYLERVPKEKLRELQKEILCEFATQNLVITKAFCVSMAERLAQNKDLEYGLSKDVNILKDVLLALKYIENLGQETYYRNFSEMVFHDSKRLQRILNPLSKILLDYGNQACPEENILAQYNLINNPGYVHIKGDWQIWCRDRSIPVNVFRGGIAISSDALDDIERIAVPSGTVISVENLTTFHDTKETQGAIIYLGGFLNTVRTNFLKKLYMYEPKATYFHKGDLDPYGFLILENLKEKTGIPFEPLEMDLETLRVCYQSGHFRPLEAADKKTLALPVLREYDQILKYMLENNCKIEQECFEAMKLELRGCHSTVEPVFANCDDSCSEDSTNALVK